MYEENYEELANAVILLAVKDLRTACRRVKRRPEDTVSRGEIRSISRFFRSGYFSNLTTLDGPALLEKIINEVEGKE